MTAESAELEMLHSAVDKYVDVLRRDLHKRVNVGQERYGDGWLRDYTPAQLAEERWEESLDATIYTLMQQLIEQQGAL